MQQWLQKPLDAISNLETAMPYDASQSWTELGDAFPSIYLRGYAHLQAGQPTDATLDFKKFLLILAFLRVPFTIL